MDEFEQKGNSFEIAVISDNPTYRDAIQKITNVTFVIFLSKIETNLRCKAIFIDGSTISYRDLNEYRTLYPTTPMFFKLHNVTDHNLMKNIDTVCRAFNITPINENLTPDQVANEISKVLFESNQEAPNRVISFFGTHSGAGVSTTALNVAKALSLKVEERVLLLSLNPWDPSDYFLSYQGKYLNDIKVDLKTDSINEQKLMDSVCAYKGFYHLAGNRDIKLQRFYKTEEIERLIRVAQACFDVVIIDAGPHFDNANYAQSFIQSDLKFLVTDQQEKGYRGYWPYVFQQLIEPIGESSNEFILLLNRFRPEAALISEKDLQEELDMSLLTTIPDEGILGSISIRQKQLLYEIADEPYRQAIHTIVNSIVARSKLTVKKQAEQEEKKKGFFAKLFGSGKSKKEDDWYEEEV